MFATLSRIAAGLLAVAMFAQELPRAPASEVQTITPKPGYFTEPSVAVNPQDPSQVVTAYQDNAHVAYSHDDGKTWRIATGTEASNYKVSGDVSITFDKQGHAILCYIAFDKLGTSSYWGHNSSRNGIFIRRSLDGGQTWEPDHVPVTEQPNVTPDHKFVPWEDKPYAKVKVDKYLSATASDPSPARSAIGLAMRFYELGAQAWNIKIASNSVNSLANDTALGKILLSDPEIIGCPGVASMMDTFRQMLSKQKVRPDAVAPMYGLLASERVPVFWTCASGKIAEAEASAKP
jgi:hypothetical protein